MDYPNRWLPVFAALVIGVALVATAPTAGVLVGQTDENDLEPATIVIAVDIDTNGDAVWIIEHRYRLADAETEAAFDDLAADIDADPSTYVDRFSTRIEDMVADAAVATGREMTVHNVTIATEKRALPRDYGIVRYRFEWIGFASVTDGTITVGDAISGFFLDADSRLRIEWPDEFTVDTVSPTPDEQRDTAVVWNGPIDFGTDEPRLVLTTEPPPPSPDDDTTVVREWPLAVYGVVGILIIVAGLSAWRWWSGRSWRAKAPSESEESAAVDVDEELLSNEEKVLRLVADHGGRIKQKEVTETFGWSDANTSQVVRDLRESGKIETFRIGRENVIVIPEEKDDEFT